MSSMLGWFQQTEINTNKNISFNKIVSKIIQSKIILNNSFLSLFCFLRGLFQSSLLIMFGTYPENIGHPIFEKRKKKNTYIQSKKPICLK